MPPILRQITELQNSGPQRLTNTNLNYLIAIYISTNKLSKHNEKSSLLYFNPKYYRKIQQAKDLIFLGISTSAYNPN